MDLAITNARIFDGTGGVIERGTLLISDDRILSVSSSSIEASAEVIIDADGRLLMPGMIDVRRHLVGASTDEDLGETGLIELPAKLQDLLKAGFTTVLSANHESGVIKDIQRRIDRGRLAGPRLMVVGSIYVETEAGSDTSAEEAEAVRSGASGIRVNSQDAARRAVGTLQRLGSEVVEVHSTGSGNTGTDELHEILRVVVDEARTRELLVILDGERGFFHDNWSGFEGIRLARVPARRSPSAELLPRIPVATAVVANARIIDHNGAAHTPMGIEYTPANGEILRGQLSNLKKVWNAGGTIAFGTGRTSGLSPTESARLEAWTLSEAFSASDILTVLTTNAANYLGLGADIGTLEPGKLADMVLIDGDPLSDVADLAKVALVIKDGVIAFENL